MLDATLLGGGSNLLKFTTNGHDTISLGGPGDTGPGAVNLGIDRGQISVGLLGHGITLTGTLKIHTDATGSSVAGAASHTSLLSSLTHGSTVIKDFVSGHTTPAAHASPDVHSTSSHLMLADGNHIELKNFVPAHTDTKH